MPISIKDANSQIQVIKTNNDLVSDAGTSSNNVLTIQGANNGVNIPINVISNQITQTDRSSNITVGGTAQTLMSLNNSRKGFFIQNLSAGDLYINNIGTATLGQGSIKIPPGALYESSGFSVTTAAISIIGATTSQSFTSREW